MNWEEEHNQRRIQWLEWFYEAMSRAECWRQGLDPDDSIADGGHLAWHLVGYEAACKEMPPPAPGTRAAGIRSEGDKL